MKIERTNEQQKKLFEEESLAFPTDLFAMKVSLMGSDRKVMRASPSLSLSLSARKQKHRCPRRTPKLEEEDVFEKQRPPDLLVQQQQQSRGSRAELWRPRRSEGGSSIRHQRHVSRREHDDDGEEGHLGEDRATRGAE